MFNYHSHLMATALPLSPKNGNGKRERNQMDAEDSEFAPLSKRINNLHLHQSQGGHSSHHSQQQQQPHPHAQSSEGHSDKELLGRSNDQVSGQQNHHHHHQGFRAHTGAPHGMMNGVHSSIDNSGSYHESARYSEGSHNELPKLNNNLSNGHHHHHQQQHQQQQQQQQQHELHPHENLNGSQHYDYSPSLSSSSNPHYFEQNRQLYLLYLERMQRTGQALHPHFLDEQL